jgi:hypothetical protein
VYDDGSNYYYDEEVPPEYHAGLYHVPTGELAFSGAVDTHLMKNGTILLCGRDGSPMGFINAKGEAVSGFPPPKTYYGAEGWNNWVLASTQRQYDRDLKGTEVILDADWNTIFTCDWLSSHYSGLRGDDYLAFRDGDKQGVYAIDSQGNGGEIFSVSGASIDYFDGERAIVQTGSYRGPEQIDARLENMNHEVLSEGFSWLATDDLGWGSESPAESFIGIKGGKAVRIGKNGEELAASVDIPNIRNINHISKGLYSFNTEDGDIYSEGLLNAELEILVPAGKYNSFGVVNESHEPGKALKAGEAIIEAYKEMSDVNRPGLVLTRYDIFDSGGRIIMDNITNILGVGENRLAIERGFSMGLIDFDGNWIVKRSIFSGNLQD